MDGATIGTPRPERPGAEHPYRPVENEPAAESPRIEQAPPSPGGSAPASVPVEAAVTPSTPPAAAKSQLEREIEDVLTDGLEEIYWELAEPERLIFKHQGEEAASKIRLLLGETTVRVKEIFRLIVEWLKLLPGVNQFFIEQEAKIKTDRLLKFH